MNPKDSREALFSCLSTVLKLSMEKFKREQKADAVRLKWGRLIVNGVSAYGKLLETVQLDELEKGIEAIKEHLKMNPNRPPGASIR